MLQIVYMGDEMYFEVKADFEACKNKKKWKGRVTYCDGSERKVRHDKGRFYITVEGREAVLVSQTEALALQNDPDMPLYGLTVDQKPLSREDFFQIAAQNQTGSHYRNRTVKVPTRPSQPARG